MSDLGIVLVLISGGVAGVVALRPTNRSGVTRPPPSALL